MHRDVQAVDDVSIKNIRHFRKEQLTEIKSVFHCDLIFDPNNERVLTIEVPEKLADTVTRYGSLHCDSFYYTHVLYNRVKVYRISVFTYTNFFYCLHVVYNDPAKVLPTSFVTYTVISLVING